ncbi:GTP pyrophosphokinase YjbM [Sporomusa ovata DSM 2662]|uniref:RelA/SpoT n=1 Tax=Sporomusa ovata TaxID=2378 RepID=A0A0U1L711_9FIRM|nr:hypothetical protein [Sporomusa ovata]EQB28591.1 hypothetical protein SOV_1c02800 [Sporomusa ovata DSM 2662]CQR74923.1 RelA/SpoT [Sporomusa ovata]
MEKILDLYRKNHSMYNDFTHEMQDLVTNFLMKKNIRIHSIVSRVKGETSLKNKIVKKNYTKLEGITDLCGIRIITYFSDDVDLVANIIQEAFTIDPINSVDKRKLLPVTQFGYLSVHFIASLTTSQLQLPNYKNFANCKVEIQICSILQHAWAEIEHDLEYKSQATISYNVRRKFSRLAGLLEIADSEFVVLRDHLQPSSVLAKKALFAPELLPSKASTPQTLSEKLRLKFPFFEALGSTIKKHIDFTTLKIGSTYTAMGMILALLITHMVNLPHLFSAITAYIHTEKHVLFSLISIYSV